MKEVGVVSWKLPPREMSCQHFHEISPEQKYRITGIFCGCLIFAEICRSIEIAEIKNRKIFQSRYNDEIVSKVIVQSRIFRSLLLFNYLYNAEYTVT